MDTDSKQITNQKDRIREFRKYLLMGTIGLPIGFYVSYVIAIWISMIPSDGLVESALDLIYDFQYGMDVGYSNLLESTIGIHDGMVGQFTAWLTLPGAILGCLLYLSLKQSQ